MIFYPAGPNPQWLYVANTDSVVRYAYKAGDLKATGKPETVIAALPSSRPRDEVAWRAYDAAVEAGKPVPDHGHWTRDLALSLDGKRLFVGVGSASNLDNPDDHPSETRRADILEYTPEGKFVKIYASGIRNPSGIAVDPATGQLWCSVNERDGLGDDLAPDYISHVQEGGFYGWPWYYMGGNQDPRLKGKHPELKDKVIVPDVLLQSHSASLQITFYDGKQFPAEYRGDIFASEHGSWNRQVRSGYEVLRVPLKNGKASGIYEDFLTGFLTPNGDVWGRPVGVATAPDGSLLVSDDGSGSIWRVSYTVKKSETPHRAGDQDESADGQHQHDDRVEKACRLEVNVQVGNYAGENKERAAGSQYPPGDTPAVPEQQSDSNQHRYQRDAESVGAAEIPVRAGHGHLIGQKVSAHAGHYETDQELAETARCSSHVIQSALCHEFENNRVGDRRCRPTS